jgi:hypothetical protein
VSDPFDGTVDWKSGISTWVNVLSMEIAPLWRSRATQTSQTRRKKRSPVDRRQRRRPQEQIHKTENLRETLDANTYNYTRRWRGPTGVGSWIADGAPSSGSLRLGGQRIRSSVA